MCVCVNRKYFRICIWKVISTMLKYWEHYEIKVLKQLWLLLFNLAFMTNYKKVLWRENRHNYNVYCIFMFVFYSFTMPHFGLINPLYVNLIVFNYLLLMLLISASETCSHSSQLTKCRFTRQRHKRSLKATMSLVTVSTHRP